MPASRRDAAHRAADLCLTFGVLLCAGLGTLAGVYGAARASGHIPSGMWWPFISFLGFRAPERVIYVCGFTATAAGIVVAAVFADQTLLCLVEPQHR